MGEGSGKPGEWRNKWLEFPIKFQTEIINFAGKGNTVHMVRELRDAGSSINFEVTVVDPATEAVICGPFATVFKRLSDDTPGEPPQPQAGESIPLVETPAEPPQPEAGESIPLVETPVPLVETPAPVETPIFPAETPVPAEAKDETVTEVAALDEVKQAPPTMAAEQNLPIRKERNVC